MQKIFTQTISDQEPSQGDKAVKFYLESGDLTHDTVIRSIYLQKKQLLHFLGVDDVKQVSSVDVTCVVNYTP